MSALFIKICGMTTPVAVDTALACEVDAIGFVFAASVRQVTPQRASELASVARHKAACVAVTRHPTRAEIEEILRDFHPTSCRPDIEDIDPLNLPRTLSVLPGDAAASRFGVRIGGQGALRRAGERQRPDYRLAGRGGTRASLRGHPAGG
jgi:hypothetical protein